VTGLLENSIKDCAVISSVGGKSLHEFCYCYDCSQCDR